MTPASSGNRSSAHRPGPLDPEHVLAATYALDQSYVRGLTDQLVATSGTSSRLLAPATGQPLGSSGARILTTLIHALRARGGGLGLASLCVGVGQGVSTIVEVEDGF